MAATTPNPNPNTPEGHHPAMSQHYVHPHYAGPAPEPRNGLAVAALVLGLVGLVMCLTGLTAWLGILLGLIGTPLALVGFGRVRRGRASKGLTISGLVAAPLAIVFGIASTVATLNALDEAFSGPTATSVGAPTGETPTAAAAAPEADGPHTVAAGTTVDVEGLQVTASALEARNDYGKRLLCTQVTYVNGRGEAASRNPFDWTLQDPNGAATSNWISTGGDPLRSGDLAPGGRASGDVCFEDTRQDGDHKILYTANLFEDPAAAWTTTRP